MAKEKSLKSLHDLKGGTMDELVLEATVATADIKDENAVITLAVTADEWDMYSHTYSILKNAQRDPNNKDHRDWVHAKLLQVDEEYAARYKEIRTADEALKNSKSKPAPGGIVEEQVNYTYKVNKEDRIDEWIETFNKAVEKRLEAVPEEIRKLLDANDGEWEDFKRE